MYEEICLVTPGRLHYTPAYTLNLLESTLPTSSYNRLSTISTYHIHPFPPADLSAKECGGLPVQTSRGEGSRMFRFQLAQSPAQAKSLAADGELTSQRATFTKDGLVGSAALLGVLI